MTSHCITWHDTTQAITSHQMTWPSHDLTPQQTSRHQNTSLQSTKHHHHGTAEGSFTAKKWFGHRAGRSPCAHSIGKFFLCYIVLFLLETSAPGLSGHYWYTTCSIYLCFMYIGYRHYIIYVKIQFPNFGIIDPSDPFPTRIVQDKWHTWISWNLKTPQRASDNIPLCLVPRIVAFWRATSSKYKW